MSDSVVTYSDKTTRSVKNLGWLIRHSQYVASIELRYSPNGGALMVVTLYQPHGPLGRYPMRYETAWADYGLARTFSTRRRFSDSLLIEQVSNLRKYGYA